KLKPLSTAFFSTSVVQNFQDSPDDKEDTRSSYEYLNDLKEEYQARSLLAKSKRIFKKGIQRFSSAKETDQTECHKCGKKGHFARDYWSETSAKKGLITETYNWDDKEVSSDDNEVTEVKALMALANEERVSAGKESARNGDWTKISMKKVHTLLEIEDNDDRKSFLDYLYNSDMSITSINIITKLSETEDSTLPNHDTVCSNSSSFIEEVRWCEPVSRPKNIKSILKSRSTFKAKTLKGIAINGPSSAPAKGKSSSASKTNLAPAGKLKNMKMEDGPPLAIVMKELNELKLQFSTKKPSYSRNKDAQQHHTGQGESSSRSKPSRPWVSFPSYIHCGYNDHHSNDYLYYPTCEICGSYDHDTHGHNRIISLRRGINPRNPQHVTKNCGTCGRNLHTTSDHNDIEWFRKRETL
nr:retrovirus-related Pol polyprotein from transposon TNT 1-94 [Tanacetum cinerariifolium]